MPNISTKTRIHPYLVARFRAVQMAFQQLGMRHAMAVPYSSAPKANFDNPAPAKHWRDILKEDDEDGKGGGGGGTIRGLRGKDTERAKAAMRRLGK